jgi:hypothetical protein
MRIPYLIGVLPVIGDNATSVARWAAPFVVGAFINNSVPVAFRASFFSYQSRLRAISRSRWFRRHLKFLDRLLDGRFLVWLIVDDSDKLGRRAFKVVDRPRMAR